MITISNKILFIIISLALASIAIGVIGYLTENPDLEAPLPIGIITFILFGTYLLAKNGTFINSDEYRFTRLGIAIFIVGVLMMLMHWSHAKEIMLIGYLSVPFIYLFHMIKHKRTRWTNFSKLFLTFLIICNKSMLLFHIPYADVLIEIAIILVLLLIADALINKKIQMNE